MREGTDITHTLEMKILKLKTVITESHVTRKRWIKGHKPLKLEALGLMLSFPGDSKGGSLPGCAGEKWGEGHLNENKTERELAL